MAAFALALAVFAAAAPDPAGPVPAGPVPAGPAAADATGSVARCVLSGTVDSGSAEYLVSCVARADELGAHALLVVLDTPGGSLEATREIVKAFLGSKVPVLVWVGPPGARAGSAGVFVTLAAHLAAMAPGTNIGAAHPVVGPGGSDPEQAGGKEMARKVENDAAAFARAIAHERGRNEEWAAASVLQSESITAEQAVEKRVVDLVAPTEQAFLESAHHRTVKLDGGQRLIVTRAPVIDLTPTLPQHIVHALSNPGLAYLLFLVGVLGLAMEFSHPGLVAPGLIGGVSLVLALIAFSALPVQLGALVLLLAGVGLVVAEIFVGHGALGVSGVVLMLAGGVLLVDRLDPEWFVDPSFRVPLWTVIPSAVLLGGAAVFVAMRGAQTRKIPQFGGDVGLVGETGSVLADVGPAAGEVFVHGERWQARAAGPIPKGTRVRVERVVGLVVHVKEV